MKKKLSDQIVTYYKDDTGKWIKLRERDKKEREAVYEQMRKAMRERT